MTTDFPWLALTYSGMLAAAATAVLGCFSVRDGQRAGRAAWCAAWLAATGDCLLRRGQEWPIVDLAGAFAPAAWTVAAALLARLPRRSAGSAAVWLSVIVVVAAIAWYSRGPASGGCVAGAIAFGGLVDRAMTRGSWLAFRLAAYWSSFVGTFAILIPIALSARDSVPRLVPSTHGLPLAAVLVAAAAPLALAATRAFATAGGTPEPLDAPVRLCRTGIYSYIRHPIQLAEILFVAAGAAAIGTRSALLFLVAFVIALAGPLRVIEERLLAARFGPSFDEYRRTCPGFLPRTLPSSRRGQPLMARAGNKRLRSKGGDLRC